MARKGGQGQNLPAFVPTKEQRDMVEFMAAIGIPQDDIARLVKNPATGKGIDPTTLRAAFRDELNEGAIKATVAVGKNLFRIATSKDQGAVASAIFWMKTRAHWRETMDVNLGGTVTHEHENKPRDLSKLTDAEVDKLYEDEVRASSPTQRMPKGTTH